ncbi:MAG: hypothetical protein Q7W16_02985 [Coriobacteriia bacterium]|nr:hypothetical protein [Coriobacteriia bacterium]
MSRRSVSNDRYRVEQKGKTRKSASSAKPKREAGEAATAGKKPTKKSTKSSSKPKLFGWKSSGERVPPVPSTPEMKRLRKLWWIAMGVAIVIAVAMVPIGKYKNTAVDSVLFGLYAAALGAALYLEFGPLRKARIAATAEAKAKGGKGSKAAKPATKTVKSAKGAKPTPEAIDATDEKPTEEPEGE